MGGWEKWQDSEAAACAPGSCHHTPTNATTTHPHTCRMRLIILSSRLVSCSIEFTAMPPVFFFLKEMAGGLRLRRMPTWGEGSGGE